MGVRIPRECGRGMRPSSGGLKKFILNKEAALGKFKHYNFLASLLNLLQTPLLLCCLKILPEMHLVIPVKAVADTA